MTTRIRKVFTAIDANGNAFSEQHAETLVNGKWFALDPTPLVDGSAWATQFNAALELENSKLKADKAQLIADHAEALAEVEADLATANATVATLQATIASLEATIVELTPPPKPVSVTPAQIRLWLISNGISLDTVAQMIAAIPHEATREAASVRWEYGLVVLRDDPLVQQMGAALGFTTEQMDAAFLHASQID